MQEKLKQTKLNAISATILHRSEKNRYEKLNKLLLILTLIVPLFFIIAQYVTKATEYETLMNSVSFALSIILIAVSIGGLILKINDKIVLHKMGMRDNIFITHECDRLAKLPEQELSWFYRYISEIDTKDADVFSRIPDNKRKEIYRQALKELEPGNSNITCPVCHSSPWNFKKGDCQLCGNTKTQ